MKQKAHARGQGTGPRLESSGAGWGTPRRAAAAEPSAECRVWVVGGG
eukprot:CAMPEP_0183358146 /NCGR_PEP_ID=MMETSP0164_2-20130417/48336_1 /TAXON_ID=221442 /ORGANISM="Coccolithus pelagicus ssp braarudi, Strain PLY182g" /LENGTH=46 /DNA_ID= /DNA_START= /DNA_END= /DNA_ORIENTATION=